MGRHYSDWIDGFMQYASFGEAPRHFYFWTAVSTIAGAIRRKVWIDQAYFKWYANFYICLVAPPGIVSKSTTAGIGMNLLRQVPDIHFGPDVVTWPALVSAFAEKKESFQLGDAWHEMCAMTLESSEFGNLLDPSDKDMVDLLVTLWDGKPGAFTKATKHSGSDTVDNPWINIIACTTPSWITGNFPEYMIGGGLTSRMIFAYAEEKSKYVAYPGLVVPENLEKQAAALVSDLSHIAQNLAGEIRLTPDAVRWGEAWYKRHYSQRSVTLDLDRFGGYIARKQTHMHKLAMILSIAQGDSMLITPEHLETADVMLTDLEPDMQFVFSKIGRSDTSLCVERMIKFVQGAGGPVAYDEVLRFVHSHFPSLRDFEDVFAGCVRAGYFNVQNRGGQVVVVPGVSLPTATGAGGARQFQASA